MQLKLSRSQKSVGVISSSVSFALDARVEFKKEEADLVKKYKLGDQVIYNSQRSKEHIERGMSALSERSVGGFARSMLHIVATKMALNITIDSLQKGHHIESKSLDEIIAAEEALNQACGMIRGYLDTATTFDGREQVIEF